MADNVVLTCAHLLIGGYDFSAQFNELNVNVGSESLDMSTFGSEYRKHKGGVQTASIAAKGFLNLGSSLVDDVIYGTVGGDEKMSRNLSPDSSESSIFWPVRSLPAFSA